MKLFYVIHYNAAYYDTGYNEKSTETITINCNTTGDLTNTYYFDYAIEVTCSGTLYSGGWGTAYLTLGSVKSFSHTGNYTTINVSGTYLLPAGSTITVGSKFNGSFTWSNITADGKWFAGNANITLVIRPAD